MKLLNNRYKFGQSGCSNAFDGRSIKQHEPSSACCNNLWQISKIKEELLIVNSIRAIS